MENRNLLHKIVIPEEWKSKNDYDSHRVPLFMAVIHTKGDVVELGCGDGSTTLLTDICDKLGRRFTSLESSTEWCRKYIQTLPVSEDYGEARIFMPCSVLFIDNAPGELRKDLIRDHSHNAEVLVIHDAEEGAEYVYGMKHILSTFPYKFIYKPEGKPHTAIVSHKIDVTKWNIQE